MIEIQLSAEGGICGALLADEMTAAGHPTDVFDVRYYPPSTIIVNTAATEEQVQTIVDAHDPVFITAERDEDIATVTISIPCNVDGATELTLLIDDEIAPEATPLISNAATVIIQSPDEITIGIVESYPHQEVTI